MKLLLKLKYTKEGKEDVVSGEKSSIWLKAKLTKNLPRSISDSLRNFLFYKGFKH
jgi:hypothetical protein